MSVTRNTPPLGTDFGATMARLREIAVASADNALTEGPVCADRHLLDLCAEALHALVHAKRALKSAPELGGETAAERQKNREEYDQADDEYLQSIRQAKPRLIRIRKIRATTAAGIYAKAAVVRASRTGAADLAMSLAEDLLDCPGLRAALWGAAEASEPAAGGA